MQGRHDLAETQQVLPAHPPAGKSAAAAATAVAAVAAAIVAHKVLEVQLVLFVVRVKVVSGSDYEPAIPAVVSQSFAEQLSLLAPAAVGSGEV